MNARVGGVAGNHDLSASVSFNTLRTHSPSSFTDSSSDLDTEVCYFHFFLLLLLCNCMLVIGEAGNLVH